MPLHEFVKKVIEVCEGQGWRCLYMIDDVRNRLHVKIIFDLNHERHEFTDEIPMETIHTNPFPGLIIKEIVDKVDGIINTSK